MGTTPYLTIDRAAELANVTPAEVLRLADENAFRFHDGMVHRATFVWHFANAGTYDEPAELDNQEQWDPHNLDLWEPKQPGRVVNLER